MQKIKNTPEVCEEDEIDLRELFLTIKRNKNIIFIVTSIITLSALIYVFSKTPIYEVKSNIQIGFIGKNLIEDPNTLVKTANLVFNVEDKIATKKDFVSEVTSISTNKKLKNFVTIKTQAISNDEALAKNKEVVSYIQSRYKSKIKQFILNNNNLIKAIEVKINNLENFDAINIKRQIELLKTQNIVKIDEKIKFYKTIKLKALTKKIKFHSDKLQEYNNAVKQLFQNNKKNIDTTASTIASMQMVNYQNLILNSQNKIEDLKVSIEAINKETIPNLQREKKNIQEDTIRKLTYKLKVELPNQKTKLLEQIDQLKFKNTNQYVQNSQVIGNYIIHNYPAKPKKKLIVIIAFITGLILSIFLVFFLEFLKGFKEEN